jgi:hypothetical protein
MVADTAANSFKTSLKLIPVLLVALAFAACGGGLASAPPPATPTIASFTPAGGLAGDAVTITGTNLTGATSLKFNGTTAAFTVASATQITTTVPAAATTGTISVTTSGGTATSTASFTVTNSAPTISSFTPTSGLAGAAVTITGTNFTGATAVKFNGTTATFTVNSATQISATVPVTATSGAISVTTPNGTATSASSFTVTQPAPTISSFTPTSGLAAAAVTITGTNFTGATAVKFNGTTATFTVNSATQIGTGVPATATTGTISVTTPGGTATSSSTFTVVPPAPTISSFAPTTGQVGTPVTLIGTNFTGTTAVAFNGTAATFTVSSATQISTTVPTAATTGKVTVATAGGTATSASNFTVNTSSATLDLTIDGLYITQATQDYPTPSVPLVKDRSAWVRVFVRANEANSVTPQVRVRFINGATTNTITINAPSSSVPTTIDPNTNASWNSAVSSSWILAGTQVIADVDPSGAIPEADKTNNSFTDNLSVTTLKPWKITLVPVHTTDGRTGNVTSASRTKESWLDFGKRLHPVPDAIDIGVGATMNSSVATLASSGTGWSTVLNELDAKRTADGVTDRYYFGAVNVSYSSGVAGLGFISHPVAMGWDVAGSYPAVLAHEEGHNFSLEHAPCGGVANPDPNYPYVGGIIGVPGWDAFATSGNLKDANIYTDVMGYCGTQWISDYNYQKALSFRQNSPLGIIVSADIAATMPTEGLLVWGSIENNAVTLEPTFRVPFKGALPEAGPYKLEARDAAGTVLTTMSFDAHEIADLPNRAPRQFSFVVPMTPEALSNVAVLRIVRTEDGAELARRVSPAATSVPLAQSRTVPAAEAVQIQDLSDGSIQLNWDAARYPVIMVRDAQTGEVRGFLRGGSALVEEAPADLEVQSSDGVRTQPQHHRRNPQ